MWLAEYCPNVNEFVTGCSKVLVRCFGQEVEMAVTVAGTGRRIFVWGRAAVVAMVLVGASAGCASSNDSGPFRGDPVINIEIVNRNFMDATLVAQWLGGRRRLGVVTGARTANYELAWEQPQELQLEIDMLAGDKCLTRPIMVSPGDVIRVEIDIQMNRRDCIN